MPVWIPVPNFTFVQGIAQSFPVTQFVTDWKKITSSTPLPPGVTFDGQNYVYDGIGGVGVQSGVFLTADNLAIIRQLALPLADYPTGSRSIGPLAIPDTVNSIYFEFLRCTSADLTIWPDVLTTLSFSFDLSINAGPFKNIMSFGSRGGIVLNRSGGEEPLTTMTLPIVQGINRRLQATVDIVNGPLRTQSSVELRD